MKEYAIENVMFGSLPFSSGLSVLNWLTHCLLTEPKLTYHQEGHVALLSEQLHMKWKIYQSL